MVELLVTFSPIETIFAFLEKHLSTYTPLQHIIIFVLVYKMLLYGAAQYNQGFAVWQLNFAGSVESSNKGLDACAQ